MADWINFIGNCWEELCIIWQENPPIIRVENFYLCYVYIVFVSSFWLLFVCNVSPIVTKRRSFITHMYIYMRTHVERLFGSMKFHCNNKPAFRRVGKRKIPIYPLSFDIQSPKLWRSQIQLPWHVPILLYIRATQFKNWIAWVSYFQHRLILCDALIS